MIRFSPTRSVAQNGSTDFSLWGSVNKPRPNAGEGAKINWKATG
jgi:hypothetical protein